MRSSSAVTIVQLDLRQRRMLRLGLIVSIVVIVLDQLSKWWMADRVLADGRSIKLTSFFDLVVVWNKGVSFGLFSRDWAGAPWALSAVAVAVVVLLGIWLARQRHALAAGAIGAIIGGAVANVIDRARFGAVFDFIDLHYAGWHWPAFNLADSAISVGVVVLLVDSLWRERQSKA
jgi:signal peptidase II